MWGHNILAIEPLLVINILRIYAAIASFSKAFNPSMNMLDIVLGAAHLTFLGGGGGGGISM